MLQLKRLVKGGIGFVRLVKDMNRTDEVFEIVAEMGDAKLIDPLVRHFSRDDQGARALTAWPRVGRIDLQALSALPKGTLGHEYAAHMTALKFDPDFHPQIPVQDQRMFLRMHLYETHDIWHVVTGFKTDVAGELGLQAFYLAQFPIGPVPPVLLAAGLLNTALYARDDADRRMTAIADGWKLGKQAKQLFGERWADLWQEPLSTIRQRYNLTRDITAA